MNLLWKSLLNVSFTNLFSSLWSSLLAQFLKTTSSSHLRFTVKSSAPPSPASLPAISINGLACKIFSLRSRSFCSWSSACFRASSSALSCLILASSAKSSSVSSSSESSSSEDDESTGSSLSSCVNFTRFFSISSSSRPAWGESAF